MGTDRQKDGSEREREGLQAGSETSSYVSFEDCGTNKKAGGRAATPKTFFGSDQDSEEIYQRDSSG